MVLVFTVEVKGRPGSNTFNPIDDVAILDPAKVVCTEQVIRNVVFIFVKLFSVLVFVRRKKTFNFGFERK